MWVPWRDLGKHKVDERNQGARICPTGQPNEVAMKFLTLGAEIA
jgi:hypothetical protein